MRGSQGGTGRPNSYLQSSKSSCKSTKYRGIPENQETHKELQGGCGRRPQGRAGAVPGPRGVVPAWGEGGRPGSPAPLTRHLGMGLEAGPAREGRGQRERGGGIWLRIPPLVGGPAPRLEPRCASRPRPRGEGGCRGGRGGQVTRLASQDGGSGGAREPAAPSRLLKRVPHGW